jgi:CubicO group peptidase (beta-lactamase class C family)
MDTLDPERLRAAAAYVDSWLAINFDNSRLPGVQVAIRQGQELVLSKAFGHADLEAGEPLTTDHLFRIASHSKTFTATGLMQLKEAGLLNLDDPVRRHLDWFESTRDDRIAEVTVRQLMTHAAGVVRDGDDSDFWQLLRPFPDAAELREYLSTARLVYDSDERFKYSNYGYGYLGLVIEAVSGLPYGEYVTDNIVERLGLESTGPDLDAAAKARLARGYGIELFHGTRRAFEHAGTRALAAATGFYSNAEDVCLYFAAHFFGDTRLIGDPSKRQMQQCPWTPEGTHQAYGLGLVRYPRERWAPFGHGGGFPGFITNTQFDPRRAIVVSVLTNATDGPADRIVSGIYNILDTFQEAADPVDPRAIEIERFAGRFYSTWGPLDVVAAGGKLFGLDPLWWTKSRTAERWQGLEDADELVVCDETTLTIQRGGGFGMSGEEIRYDFDETGSARSITYAGRTMLPWPEAQRRGWFAADA